MRGGLSLFAVENFDSPVIELHFLGLPFRPLVVLLTISAGPVEPIPKGSSFQEWCQRIQRWGTCD